MLCIFKVVVIYKHFGFGLNNLYKNEISIRFIFLVIIIITMKVLFICNQNEHRSKTAEELFKDKFKTKSAGLYNEKPVTEKQLSWADVVVVMEDAQRTEIAKRFPKQYMQRQIICFDIPDMYHYNQPELIEILKSKINELT